MSSLRIVFVLACLTLVMAGMPTLAAAADSDPYIIKNAFGWPVIDGQLENIWRLTDPLVISDVSQITAGSRSVWKGPGTLSGKVYLLLEGGRLFIGADITDDHPLASSGTGSELFDGSSIELFFSSRAGISDGSGYTPFDYRVLLGLDKDGKGVIWFTQQAASAERATNNAPAIEGQIAATRKPDGTGYVLEAMIPIQNFGLIPYLQVTMGRRVAFDVALNHASGTDGKVHRDLRMMWHGSARDYETSSAWRQAYIYAMPGFPAETPAQGAGKVSVQVQVTGDTAREINGCREIPKEIFGARVLSIDRGISDRPSFISTLKEAGFDSFFYYIYPGNLTLDKTKNWEDPARPGHLKSELFEHPERVWGNEEQFVGDAFENLRQVNPDANYELCLQACPEFMGLKPIKPGPADPAPADPEEYARMSSALLRLYQSDPRGTGRNVKFLTFMNEPEPFAHWGSEEFKNDPTAIVPGFSGQKGVDYYIKTFNAISSRVKADFPGMLLGGPVAAFPGQALNWSNWKNWGTRFIDGAGALCDFYDYHPYADLGTDSNSILAQATMVMNHVLITQKRPMKTVLSEQNRFGIDKNDAGDRFLKQMLWNQRVLFMELDNPDKFAGHYYFIVFDDRTFRDFDELQPSNLWHGADGKLIPYPVYYLYRGLRDLRGTRLYARSSQPDVSVRASINGNKLCAVVFNDAYQQADVDLSLDMPKGSGVKRVLMSGWDYDKAKNEFNHFEDREVSAKEIGRKLGIPVSLTPFASCSIVVELNGKPGLGKSYRTNEYYSDKVFVEDAAESKPVFAVNVPRAELKNAESFVVRLGWAGPKPDYVMVGKGRYKVPSVRSDISEIQVAEIPLKKTDVSKQTRIRPIYTRSRADKSEKMLFVTLTATEGAGR